MELFGDPGAKLPRDGATGLCWESGLEDAVPWAPPPPAAPLLTHCEGLPPAEPLLFPPRPAPPPAPPPVPPRRAPPTAFVNVPAYVTPSTGVRLWPLTGAQNGENLGPDKQASS